MESQKEDESPNEEDAGQDTPASLLHVSDGREKWTFIVLGHWGTLGWDVPFSFYALSFSDHYKYL